jgi:hypothetical protein
MKGDPREQLPPVTHKARFKEHPGRLNVTRMGQVLIVWHGWAFRTFVTIAPRSAAIELVRI